jgi:hypothetical protein
METNNNIDGGSPFRIKRPLITTSGFVSDVDATIKSHLDELNALLGKRIFTHDPKALRYAVALAAAAKPLFVGVGPHDIKVFLESPLTPKRTSGDAWADPSLAYEFNVTPVSDKAITLADFIDVTADLSSLKYAFQGNLSANWSNLDSNTKAVLDGYPAITDYLLAYAFFVMGLKEVHGLKNFILSNRTGVKNVANYAIVSAARTIIDKKELKVSRYNDDDSEIVKDIKGAGLSVSSASFKTALQAVVDDFIFNATESRLIDNAGIGTLPAGIKPLLIKYIKHSPVPITAANVKFFLPLFISQIKGTTEIADPTEVDTAESDKDFDVEFLQDDNSLIR